MSVRSSVSVPPEFIFVGEHSAPDFANTFVMTNGQETDYLRTCADVVGWFSLTGLSVDPGLKLAAAYGAKALESVMEFRQAWKAELARIISGDKVSDEFIERLNRLLADTFLKHARQFLPPWPYHGLPKFVQH